MQNFDASRAAADESFQLPMLGLYADLESGAASVSLPDHFQALAPDLRYLALSGWLQGLNQARDELLRRHPDILGLKMAEPAPGAADDDPA